MTDGGVGNTSAPNPWNPAELAKYLFQRMRHRFPKRRQSPAQETWRNIYPRLGVVFVHIPKTAGTSLNELLSGLEDQCVAARYAPNPNLVSLSERREATIGFDKHAKAERYVEFVGKELWSHIPSIAVVRNPWDFAVSSYHWWIEKGDRFPRHVEDALRVKRMSGFEEFVQSDLFATTTAGHPGQMQDWFQNNGKDLVTFVAKLENLGDDVRRFLSGSAFAGEIGTLRHLNASRRKPYRDYYTAQTASLVRDRYSYIIDRFDYEF